ncbi:DUF2971 domain-containing protein [Paenibacillus anaericanus]|uniref:DUF2971 domain-containing protein n=1 Tax=Paenibacillus anaericanus TaxID=170367 RepID=A0A3S1C5D1_9BACL|nr:DUF2971 domain-containing protein [Paenibacillus anaericanus]RUT43280.1 DUF2971 domain-containing protein [Paenibacillus anaericanus]
MYRFRSIENLIGEYQELERQQIYFADIEQLNDPMEGKRRYFFQGDRIVWKNLLKNYLLCLERSILLTKLMSDNETFSKDDIPIFISEENLPTKEYEERIKEIKILFFSDERVQSFLNFIDNHRSMIYVDELQVHLKLLHHLAIDIINRMDGLQDVNPTSNNLYKVWDELYDKLEVENAYDVIIQVTSEMLREVDFHSMIKLKDSPKMQSIYFEFPRMYLDSITKLTYPKSYVACFMDNCENSSIWGTYGNSHTGVCLKFKIGESTSPKLSLKTAVSYGGNGYYYDYRDHVLKPIDYTTQVDEIDFFRNLGRLTHNQIWKQWYTDENGNESVCSGDTVHQMDEWITRHWGMYAGAFLKKTVEWSQEREYRIILTSVLDFFEESSNRLLEYKFEDLEGIIFGVRTPYNARIQIIEIIRRKCIESGRKEFDFYEMYISTNKELNQRKMPILITEE